MERVLEKYKKVNKQTEELIEKEGPLLFAG